MFRRRRPLLRAAAVGGTAYVAGKHMANKQAEQQYTDDDQEARLSALEQQQASGYGQPPPADPGPAAGPSIADQLNQLVELHNQGALTDEEFAAAKASVLGGSG